MNKYKLIAFIAMLLLSRKNFSQDLQWYGYGSGLSHIKIFKDKIKLQTVHDIFEESFDYFESKSGELVLYTKQDDSNYYKGNPRIRFVNSAKDSLYLNYRTQEYLFVDTSKVTYKNKYVFNSVILEHLSSFTQTISKIEFNRFSIIRKSDGKNSTIVEAETTLDEINKFKEIISKLDIKNIYATDRWRNNCNNDEYSFTFIDLNGIRYNYTAIDVRESLLPVYHYLNALATHYKSK